MQLVIVVLLSCLLVSASAFAPAHTQQAVIRHARTTELNMGLFDFLSGPTKSATASHILLKGPNASKQCEKLKADIYKKAIGRGDASGGIEAEKLMGAFAQIAKSKSTCPSKNKGGSLGTFGPGEMVPEFDQVAFKKEVGVVHGPIVTEFGSHLILITDRE